MGSDALAYVYTCLSSLVIYDVLIHYYSEVETKCGILWHWFDTLISWNYLPILGTNARDGYIDLGGFIEEPSSSKPKCEKNVSSSMVKVLRVSLLMVDLGGAVALQVEWLTAFPYIFLKQFLHRDNLMSEERFPAQRLPCCGSFFLHL